MAYKCECLFVCVILHLQPLHTDLDPSWTSSSDPITPSLPLSTLLHGQYHHHNPYNQQCFIALCVDKIYNISVKTVMRFELFVRWNSKARIPIDGEASRFCVCVFIVMLSFCISKAIVFTTGGEVIFSWWFSPENQDRESSYTFSMQWYECLQTESEGMRSLRGETSILVCCNAHSHPKLDGRCQTRS